MEGAKCYMIMIMFDCTPDTSYTEQMSEVILYIKITEN